MQIKKKQRLDPIHQALHIDDHKRLATEGCTYKVEKLISKSELEILSYLSRLKAKTKAIK